VWALSCRLHTIDALSFAISTIGVVLATGVVNALEWVPITVLLCILLSAVAEFTQLRNREVAVFEPKEAEFSPMAQPLPDSCHLVFPALTVCLRDCTNEFLTGRITDTRRQMGIFVGTAAPFTRSQSPYRGSDRARNA
jgi:hypothetical protein